MLTPFNSVCYNLHTGQGQMLRVAVSLGVHENPEFGYTG
jgi:hypothetical protein